jgi:hypothetical protein
MLYNITLKYIFDFFEFLKHDARNIKGKEVNKKKK